MSMNILISITTGILSYFLFSNIKNFDSENDVIKKQIKSAEKQLENIIKIQNISKNLDKKLSINNSNNIKLSDSVDSKKSTISIDEKINKNINYFINIIISNFYNKKPIFKKNNLLWYRNNTNSDKWFKAKVNDVFIKIILLLLKYLTISMMMVNLIIIYSKILLDNLY